MSNLKVFTLMEHISESISVSIYYICHKLQVLRFVDYIFDT